MKALKCIYCKKMTEIHIISSQKRINGREVILTNAPVYHCPECKETFVSKEVQEVFNYIRDSNLKNGNMVFNFNELIKVKASHGGKDGQE